MTNTSTDTPVDPIEVMNKREFDKLAESVLDEALIERMRSYFEKKWLIVESFTERAKHTRHADHKVYRGVGRESIAVISRENLKNIGVYGVLDSRVYDLFFDQETGFGDLSEKEIKDIVKSGFYFSRIDNADPLTVKMMNRGATLRYNLNIFKYDDFKDDEEFFVDLKEFCKEVEEAQRRKSDEFRYYECSLYGVKSYLFSKFGRQWREGLPDIGAMLERIDDSINSRFGGVEINMTNRTNALPGVGFGVNPDNENVFRKFTFHHRYGYTEVAEPIQVDFSFEESLKELNESTIEIQKLYEMCQYFSKALVSFYVEKGKAPDSSIIDFIKSMDGQMACIREEMSKVDLDKLLSGNLCQEIELPKI